MLVVGMSMFACSDADIHVDEVETAQQAVTSPCNPDHAFQDCLEIDLDLVEHWQDTLPNPDWRTVTSNSDPDIDYDVLIDVNELNGGLIPTKAGQGEYSDWDEYAATKSDLLGVDYGSDRFNLFIVGSTQKAKEDGSPAPSYGFFLYDALSDEDGEVYVDNIPRASTIFHPARIPEFHVNIAGGGGSSASLPTSGVGLMHDAGWPVDLHDQKLLSDANWRADLKMFHREAHGAGGHMPVRSKASLQISGVRAQWSRNGPWFSCLWKWTPGSSGWSDGTLERHCNMADVTFGALEIAEPNYALPMYESNFETNFMTIDHVHDHWPTTIEACGWGLAIFDQSEGYIDDDFVFTDNVDPNDCPEFGPNY